MKTLQISDELFLTLQTIANNMQKQDNRMTASPYYYQVQTKDKIHGFDADHADDHIWVSDNGETDFDPDDIKSMIEHLEENDIEFDVAEFSIDEYYREEILEENNFRKCCYKNAIKRQNVFFTEQGVLDHIAANGHHYDGKDTKNYIEHAFRNPEMTAVVKLLSEIANQYPVPRIEFMSEKDQIIIGKKIANEILGELKSENSND